LNPAISFEHHLSANEARFLGLAGQHRLLPFSSTADQKDKGITIPWENLHFSTAKVQFHLRRTCMLRPITAVGTAMTPDLGPQYQSVQVDGFHLDGEVTQAMT